jgi:hypothetical protein
MARAGNNQAAVAADRAADAEHRGKRGDMVLAGAKIVDRNLHLPEIDAHAVENHLALGQAVVEVAFAQVISMGGCRHPGGIGIPVQKIEGQGIASLEIVIDDIGPDQIVRPQHVEGLGHLLSFQIAAPGHLGLDALELRFIDEHPEVAGELEIHLRGKKGCGGDATVLLGGHVAQGGGKERAADAVTDGIQLLFAGCLLDGSESFEYALAHIVAEALARQSFVRVDPRQHEHGEALLDRPSDEGFARVEIQYVEFVDPGRNDEEGAAVHRFGGRGVLQKLHQLVLADDLARRGGEVGAHLEGIEVGLANAQLAVAGGDVAGKVLQALDKVLAIAGEGELQHLGIGQGEVGGRERIGDLLDIEACLVLGVRVADIGLGHHVLGPAHRQQI